MNVKLFGVILFTLLAYGYAKTFEFKVVSIFSPAYHISVKYGDKVAKLEPTKFPLFSGTVEADNIENYSYIAVEPATGAVFQTEQVTRVYSQKQDKHEVFDRKPFDPNLVIPDLPRPFKNMFPMGCADYKPFPNNVIYNVYANCDPEAYAFLSSNPFNNDDPTRTKPGGTPNNVPVNCTINIISPKRAFTSTGSIHVIGYGSRLYKKLSWAIRFDKKFLGRRAVKLRSLASDPTLVREKLSTELFKAVGVPIQESTYARLIINNDVYGLYSLGDSFSSRWVASYIHGNPEKDIGISYKLYTYPPEYPNFKYKGEDPEQYSIYVPDEYDDKVINPEDEDKKYARVIEFTKLFNNWVENYGEDMTDKAVTELAKFLNIESVLRTIVIETLILALDNFYLRMSNAALYYHPEKNKYIILPYDFDKVMRGDTGDTMLDEATYLEDCFTWVNQHEEVLDHFFTNNLLKHPQIKKRYDVILAKASKETFAPDVVKSYIQNVVKLIDGDVKWNFDLIDGLNNGYDIGYVNHFTYEDFKENLGFGHLDYEKGLRVNDASFGVEEWVETRGNNCRAATASVDISNNENISDNDEVEAFHEDTIGESDPNGAIKATHTITILLVLTHFLLYHFF